MNRRRRAAGTGIATLFVLGGLWATIPASVRAEPGSYEIQKTAPKTAVGATATASITVVGKGGWHVNEEAPITLALKADPGVDLPKLKLARADLAQSSKESARFDIPFSPTTPGKKVITAEARFVMCQEQACKPVKETLALEIDVAAQAAPAPQPAAGAGAAKGKTKSKAKN